MKKCKQFFPFLLPMSRNFVSLHKKLVSQDINQNQPKVSAHHSEFTTADFFIT